MLICPKCNRTEGFLEVESHGAKFMVCKCGAAIQVQQSNEYDEYCKEQQLQSKRNDSKPIVECPYCHSTDTNKISSLSKAGRVALFGIFAVGKTTKQFHCNTCKADF